MCTQKKKDKIKWGSGGSCGIRGCHSQAKTQILILACFLLLTSTSLYVLQRYLFFYNFKSRIKIYNSQSSMSNLQVSHDCLALQLGMTFLSNPFKALIMRTVTNGFPSVTSVLQYLIFKMFLHDVLFTAPSSSPGGDEKVILIFQRSPVNYSTGLCIAYSLQLKNKCIKNNL